MASKQEQNGVTVIASFISPYKEASDFIEIYVSTPLAECEKRDAKGLYKKARNGELKQFTGINDPYEIPENPEIEMDTTNKTIEESVNSILKHLNKRSA